jgi:hypothetical protein
MIRDVTGLNEARDGSTPDSNSLVGLQKIAAANSNTATRHILQASLYLALRACENISLRISDSLEFALTNEALKSSISVYNVNTLEEINSLNLYDFGIFLQLMPDEEEKAVLEQNIQIALQSGGIDLEDAIDLREIKNIKLANQMLKVKRRKKQEREQQQQMQNIQAQAQANAEAAERAALAEAQKQQVTAESQIQIEQAKSNFEIQRMQNESQIKQDLMALEFSYNTKLAQMKLSREKEKEQYIEDRKDKRTRIQGSQQSEMITQRKEDLLPINFESNGNDTLGGFELEQFAPR